MKKHLLSLSAMLLLAFTFGVLVGRSQDPDPVQLTLLPTQSLHDLPPETRTVPVSSEYDIVFPVDLNTADIRTLMALPGIGEGLARRILDHRAYYGPFTRPEELLNVEGIGTRTLETILDLITTGG